VLATVFWDVHGFLLVDFTWYNNKCGCLSGNSKEAIQHKRPGLLTKGLGVLLLYDSARLHSAAATVNLLNSWGWEILPHPPYSPDLALSDFHLFPKVKKHLRGQRFHFGEDVQNEVEKWYMPRTHFFFYEGLDQLIYHYDKCLNRLDDYVDQ
jgi:transposase